MIATVGVTVSSFVGRTPSFIALGDAIGDALGDAIGDALGDAIGDALGEISSVRVSAGSTVGPASSRGVDDSNGLGDSWLGFNPPDETDGGLWTNSVLIGDGCSGEGNAEILPASDWQALTDNISKISQAIRFIAGFNPYLSCLSINMGAAIHTSLGNRPGHVLL